MKGVPPPALDIDHDTGTVVVLEQPEIGLHWLVCLVYLVCWVCLVGLVRRYLMRPDVKRPANAQALLAPRLKCGWLSFAFF